MAPGHQIEEVAALTQRIAELEAQVERLRRAEDQQFRHMADSAPFPIWSSGTDAMRNFVNRAWLEFRGRTPSRKWAAGGPTVCTPMTATSASRHTSSRSPAGSRFTCSTACSAATALFHLGGGRWRPLPARRTDRSPATWERLPISPTASAGLYSRPGIGAFGLRPYRARAAGAGADRGRQVHQRGRRAVGDQL
jgi:hypothetical protein